LTFTVVTVPRRREERTEVLAVSGQTLVPTLVIEDGEDRQVLTDENEILAYLDRRYAPRPEPQPAGPITPAEQEELGEMAAVLRRQAETVRRLAAKARALGRLDPANVLSVAADNLAEAARWIAGQAEDLLPEPKDGGGAR
jgi:glutathione S-transferase